MQHISRIYISDYGHKMCWYEGLLLSFLDKDTGNACDHIVHLENGGGKSTLLAGIFSCFEPRQDRFLKTLHESHNRFSEYFRDDGVPGFIIIEWQGRLDAHKKSRRLITGQAVSVKNVLTRDLDRVFFHFECTDDLNLETMPVPKLSAEPARDMREFNNWLHSMQSKHPGNVYSTRRQQEWEKNLESERDIDIGLLKQQLEFSKQEGAVDAFLDFKTEAEFLRKIFALTLDHERAMSVRNSIALACDRLREKPKYEHRLAILQEGEKILVAFAGSAADYEQVRAGFLDENKNAMHFTDALEGRISKRLRRQTEEEEAVRSSIALRDELQEEKQKLEASICGASFEDLRRNEAADKAKYELEEKHISAIDEQIKQTQAAKSYKEIFETDSHLAELMQRDKQARDQLAPFADAARKAGSVLKELLTRKSDACRAQAKLLNEQTVSERQCESNIEQKLKLLQEEKIGLEKKLSRFESLEQRFKTENQRFVEEKIMQNLDETAVNAIVRINQDLQNDKNKSMDEAAKIEQLEEQLEAIAKQIDSATLLQNQASSDIDKHRKELAVGEQIREELSQSYILCQVAGGVEYVDLENPELQELIKSNARHLRQRSDSSAINLAKLSAYRTELEATGLTGANPEISKILRLLAEGGVKSAIAYNEYIANVMPDADEARVLIATDPARFLGIALQDELEIELARTTLPATLNIFQPIVVSSTIHATKASGQHVVVSPASASAYNFNAAKVFAQELSETEAREKTLYKECNDEIDRLNDVENRLTNYLEQFGSEKLAALSERINAIQNEIESRTTQIIQLIVDKDETKLRQHEAREHFNNLSEQRRRFENFILLLNRFNNDVVEPLSHGRRELEKIRFDLEENSQQAETLEAEEKQLRASIERNILTFQNLDAEQKQLTSEALKIIHLNETLDAQTLLAQVSRTIESAREEYEDARSIFEAEETQRLGILSSQIEVARSSLTKLKLEYQRDFASLNLLEIIELSSSIISLEEIESTLMSERAVAADQKEQTRDCWKIAEHDLKAFKKVNPQAEEFSKIFSANLSHEELKAEIVSKKTRLKDCIENLNAAVTNAHNLNKQLDSLANEIGALQRSRTYLAESLENYVPNFNAIETDDSVVPESISEIDELVIRMQKTIKELTREKDRLYRKADGQFRNLQFFAQRPDIIEAEPVVSSYLTQNNLDESIVHASALKDAIIQRISVVEDTLNNLNKDFQESLEELVNLVGEGLHVLTTACSKKLPENAPYVGGKQILKMRTSFPPTLAETRRQMLGVYMNTIIESGLPHKNGTDLVADAILEVGSGKLGIQILKLVRDPKEMYASVDKLSNSGGEAVSMAMFLYLLVARVRSDMQAKVRQQIGGPLILDNPFAKATSSFIWRAQRELAHALGVQLLIATALPDYNTLGEFNHFIRLKKTGQNAKTERWHIEQAEFSFKN